MAANAGNRHSFGSVPMPFADFSGDYRIEERGISEMLVGSAFLDLADIGDEAQSVLNDLVVKASNAPKFPRFQFLQIAKDFINEMFGSGMNMPKQVGMNRGTNRVFRSPEFIDPDESCLSLIGRKVGMVLQNSGIQTICQPLAIVLPKFLIIWESILGERIPNSGKEAEWDL